MNENLTSQATEGASGKSYWNPYLAGLMLGGALLASFLILGAGLGASAVPIRCGAWIENLLAPAHAQASDFFGRKYLADGANPMRYFLGDSSRLERAQARPNREQSSPVRPKNAAEAQQPIATRVMARMTSTSKPICAQ